LGYRISYVGSKLGPERLVEDLELELGERLSEVPDSSAWVGRKKSVDWTILWLEDDDLEAGFLDDIELVSEEDDAIVCTVNEAVMLSEAKYLSEGEVLWSVRHLGSENIYNLEASGEVPPAYDAIRRRQLAHQERDDEVDYIFEVPLELARTILDFRHDVVAEADEFVSIHAVNLPEPERGFFWRVLRRLLKG